MLSFVTPINISAKPPIPEHRKTRQDFQLREDALIYLSCQSLFKYLPCHDAIFPEIAKRVTQAQFVFLSHRSIHITRIFQKRLQRAFTNFDLNWQDYCVILPRQNQTDYWHLNLVADIFLDNLSWSGDNTTLEAIACRLPIVTLPGEFMRNRHTYGILQMLGVTDTIANNEAEYINIAVRVGLDSQWREEIVRKIEANHYRLYDDKSCLTALEDFYQRVVKAHQRDRVNSEFS
jgi:predicted O-linked N-acetylglucosamine transferase (SPINDLY family)